MIKVGLATNVVFRPREYVKPQKAEKAMQNLFVLNSVADPWHLGWIRIRGSMPLTNGSGFGSGSCYFRHWPSRCQQKTNFLNSFFAYYFFKVPTCTSFSKLKSQKKSQSSRNQGFSYFFLLGDRRIQEAQNMWIRIRIRIRIRNTGRRSGWRSGKTSSLLQSEK
jgi:hypothetical protein